MKPIVLVLVTVMLLGKLLPSSQTKKIKKTTQINTIKKSKKLIQEVGLYRLFPASF
jgi:hypothetical protein